LFERFSFFESFTLFTFTDYPTEDGSPSSVLFCSFFRMTQPTTLNKAVPKIVIVGCGIVGAMIAYELSQQFSADISVIDQQPPAQASTGAALGVLMGAISGKVKGRTWRLREASIRRYPALIAELLAQGYAVPYNSQGIVSLCFDESELPRWQSLQEKRRAQGWPLEIWSPEVLQARCPQVDLHGKDLYGRSVEDSDTDHSVKAAIYSPADAQVNPTALTHALVSAAKARGVTFYNDAEVTQLEIEGLRCVGVKTSRGVFEADWVVLSAGLGSAKLSSLSGALSGIETSAPLELMPVLGQAMEIQLPTVLGHTDFQPVINGNDIHVVPLGDGRYWLGATVEFPPADWPQNGPAGCDILAAEATGLENLRRGAERFVGAIAQATVLKTWSGLRPRPVGQPAPVIQPLGNTENVTLATGHYRNGVLLAPATAQQVCELLKLQATNG
jgi:glycine oxidase